METPVSLERGTFDVPTPESPEAAKYPHVWLDNLKGVVIPEEGEIRFRYSRKRLTVSVTDDATTQNVELCLKAITDICDCEKEDGSMKDEPKDADEALETLLSTITEEDMKDESEDDNPEKY